MAKASTAARRRLLPLGAGAAALALVLSGCVADQEDPNGAPSSGTEETSEPSPSESLDPTAAAASQVAEAAASSAAAGTRRPQPREALETDGPGVTDGAATGSWISIASAKQDTVSVMDCARDVLDQGTLDAVATHIPNASAMSIAQLFASRDENLEFMSCSFTSSTRAENGMPMAMVRYQHNLNDERLEWCKPEPAAIADEYTFDEETNKGLMALVRPGMKGGADGAPLMPQRTGWACSDDGTEMVSITFGAMEGYGDANEGLTAIENSPVAESTTIVTEARDHLADTVLKDPSTYQDVIGKASPFFMDYQMDEKTLEEARKIPAGESDPEDLPTHSMIDRPEGAPGPVAPGQPPRVVEDD